jgi:diacylglycerol kinase (ATP)
LPDLQSTTLPLTFHYVNGSTTVEPDFVLIAANPRAGSKSRARHLQELADWLRKRQMTVEIVSDLHEAERRANELHNQRRLRALVGAGGDGTLAELLNRTVPGVPLAIYPSGTANLVARYAQIPSSCEAFGQMLLDRHTQTLDAGRANGRLFLAVCSCGFDAEVVYRLHGARTGHITALTYVRPILAAMRSYSFPEMKITPESPNGNTSQPETISARWAFVSNLPCYAGGLKPGIGADGTDGQLDLCALQHGGILAALKYLPSMFRGTQSNLNDCTIRRSERFRIESDQEVHYEIDGDPGGKLPVSIEIVPNRLTLIVPAEA